MPSSDLDCIATCAHGLPLQLSFRPCIRSCPCVNKLRVVSKPRNLNLRHFGVLGVVLGHNGVPLGAFAFWSCYAARSPPSTPAGTKRRSATKTAGRCKCFETGRWVPCYAARMLPLIGDPPSRGPIPSCGLRDG